MATQAASLYRIPFLILNAIMGQIATMPPNRTPGNEELKRYDINKNRDPLTAVMSWYLPTFVLVMQALNISELYITLAAAFPSIRVPSALSTLLSSPSLIQPLSSSLRVTPILVGGTLLGCFGALLRLACYRHLGRHFTFELALRKEHKLITDGPYSFVRHPSYLGSTLYFAGLLACQFTEGSWWVEGGMWSTALGKVVGTWWLAYVAFLLVSMVIIRTPREDKVLKEEFGEQWVKWQKQTPYRVLPLIF
ncbi:hypothetical protein EIP91_006560 [Steccherinum ochraceum]|uniref:Protein-S-isoprenylcysteine O-methyltransferase n=1 Tax=Steccherinum ochraceum TaxID=92696 RepID=A0A4R0RDX9_9APHY|nr:hypothetical protein EIP91_006560 [Steccherinum ochraceum]